MGERYQGRRKVLFHQVSWEPSHRTSATNSRWDRNQSSLLAFTIPQKWQPGTGVSIIATHIDSPNLRVRPISKRSKEGYLQVGVETYGGGIWHSWLDRDLSLAGRIVTADKNGSFASKLVKINRPLLRIPTLAIHRMRTSMSSFPHAVTHAHSSRQER